MSNRQSRAYAARFEDLLDYIDRHLDDPLSVDTLSQVAHFSRFHFLRQFSGYCGTTPGRYIQLRRMRRASERLVFNPEARVIDIALDAGFENPESFSRAFKSLFGQSPSAFRQQPDWTVWGTHYPIRYRNRTQTMNVTIVETPDRQVALIEHRGSPAAVNETAARFIAWRKETGLSPVRASMTFGIGYDDPANTPADEFRFDICGTVDAPIPDNDYGVKNALIPGGPCAVARHHGSHDTLADTVYALYRQWLPASGRAPRDYPVYFHYVNLKPDTAEHELITDVYLPLEI